MTFVLDSVVLLHACVQLLVWLATIVVEENESPHEAVRFVVFERCVMPINLFLLWPERPVEHLDLFEEHGIIV